MTARRSNMDDCMGMVELVQLLDVVSGPVPPYSD